MAIRTHIEDIWAKLAGRPSMQGINLLLFKMGSRGLGLLNYRTMEISGEAEFIRRAIGSVNSPVVFDVGANEGNWSAFVVSVNPSARIFAFEPHPNTYLRLTDHLPKAHSYNVGVGHHAEESTLHDYVDLDGSSHATCLKGVIEKIHGGRAVTTKVQIVDLDSVAEAEGITSIDLLKIDVEGMELSVLIGAKRLLSSGGVKRIQFEFNSMNTISRSLFYDFYEMLSPQYNIYRLLPHGLLPIPSYDAWMHEQFAYQNVAAVLRRLERVKPERPGRDVARGHQQA